MRPVVLRALARSDVENAVDHYRAEAGETVAVGLVDALEAAFRGVANRPTASSPRYAHALDIPGLRCKPVKRYPYLIFYVEKPDHIDVWRVLHARRDIPGSLAARNDR